MPTKTVNFGSTKAGLTTVGYRIVPADFEGALADVLALPRVTAGVQEIGGGTYRAKNVPAGTGDIRWDTGDATPMVATDEQERVVTDASGRVTTANPARIVQPVQS